MNKPDFIILHHSKGKDNIVRDFETIRKDHIEKRNFDDIGYHKVIENINDETKIISGRALFDSGAHSIGFNNTSIGVCVVGDYDDHPLEVAKSDILLLLLKSLMLVFDIDYTCVLGHRETYAYRGVPQEKTCPGEYIYMSDIRLALKNMKIPIDRVNPYIRGG